MAKSGKFKWNPAGYRAVNNSAEVQAELQRIVDRATATANGMLPADAAPFEGDVRAGKTRAHGMVKTSSDHGRAGFRNRQAQARDNILLKAMGGAG